MGPKIKSTRQIVLARAQVLRQLSRRLPYYQAAGNGHRRIRAEDLNRLMMPAISSNGVSTTRVSEESVKELVTQELRALIGGSERDQPRHEERDRAGTTAASQGLGRAPLCTLR